METTENRIEKRKCCHGRGHWIGWVFLGIIAFAGFGLLFGAVIMWLWNWLMPVVFHLGMITYWQAVGFAVLARLLFGSLHHGGQHYRGRRKCGPWGHWHQRNNDNNCRDFSGSEKWNYYEQFWNEEGGKSFDDYVRRKTGDSPQQ